MPKTKIELSRASSLAPIYLTKKKSNHSDQLQASRNKAKTPFLGIEFSS